MKRVLSGPLMYRLISRPVRYYSSEILSCDLRGLPGELAEVRGNGDHRCRNSGKLNAAARSWNQANGRGLATRSGPRPTDLGSSCGALHSTGSF